MMLSPDQSEPDVLWGQTDMETFLDSLKVEGAPLRAEPVNGEGKAHSAVSREEKRQRRQVTAKYRSTHATREQIRVVAVNVAFTELRKLLPMLPPDKKLSKIEILRLVICYISYLNHVLDV
ncbi:hypothetical protein LDENG_00011700 [Lucifuga dentata]|nr:hypothetical protein LDENG_00011700 [Lucifuga dentata]